MAEFEDAEVLRQEVRAILCDSSCDDVLGELSAAELREVLDEVLGTASATGAEARPCRGRTDQRHHRVQRNKSTAPAGVAGEPSAMCQVEFKVPSVRPCACHVEAESLADATQQRPRRARIVQSRSEGLLKNSPAERRSACRYRVESVGQACEKVGAPVVSSAGRGASLREVHNEPSTAAPCAAAAGHVHVVPGSPLLLPSRSARTASRRSTSDKGADARLRSAGSAQGQVAADVVSSPGAAPEPSSAARAKGVLSRLAAGTTASAQQLSSGEARAGTATRDLLPITLEKEPPSLGERRHHGLDTGQPSASPGALSAEVVPEAAQEEAQRVLRRARQAGARDDVAAGTSGSNMEDDAGLFLNVCALCGETRLSSEDLGSTFVCQLLGEECTGGAPARDEFVLRTEQKRMSSEACVGMTDGVEAEGERDRLRAGILWQALATGATFLDTASMLLAHGLEPPQEAEMEALRASARERRLMEAAESAASRVALRQAKGSKPKKQLRYLNGELVEVMKGTKYLAPRPKESEEDKIKTSVSLHRLGTRSRSSKEAKKGPSTV